MTFLYECPHFLPVSVERRRLIDAYFFRGWLGEDFRVIGLLETWGNK